VTNVMLMKSPMRLYESLKVNL